MKRENFYRREPNKALAGMVGLSLEERGVYNTVLDLLYSTWRPLEDDRGYIANWCGCAVQKLNPIIRRLIERGRLITFEEGGRTYLSDQAFEDERAAVKGGGSTRSGRGKVAEKSGEVGEKSAGIEENPPTCRDEDQQKQSDAALDKRREDKKEPPNPPEGGGQPLFDLQPDEKLKVDDVEVAFAEWNDLARRRGLPIAKSLDDARRRAIRKRLEADGLDGWREALAGVDRSAFLLGQRAGSDGRTMKADLGFVCQARSYPRLREGFYGDDAAAPVTAMPALVWPGPPELLADLRHQMGPARADSFLRSSSWDADRRAIVTASPTVAAMIRRDADQAIRAHHAKVIEEIAA